MSRTLRPLVRVFALVVLSLVLGGCDSDPTSLQATVVAQGQMLEVLARTPTPLPAPTSTPLPTPTSVPTHTPSPTPSPRPSPTSTSTPTLASLVESALPSILRVTTGDAVGTGFVFGRSERVLTALHVVEGSRRNVVLLSHQGVQHKAKVVASDETRDLALLSVPGLSVPPLSAGAEASAGDAAIVVGYSASLPGAPSVTKGIISAKRLDPRSGVAVIQTDATVNPGASGGPLLGERGEVLGLVVSKLSGEADRYEGLGFAVTTAELARFLDEAEAE